MACRKVILSALPPVQRQQVGRALSTSAIQQDQGTTSRPPHRSARFLLEATEQQQRQGSRRLGGARRGSNTQDEQFNEDDGEAGSNSEKNRGPPRPRFQAPPSIPYDTTKELQFPDENDWEVSSVVKSRPIYANIAASRGTWAPLGTAAVNGRNYNPLYPGTTFSAHLTGVRSNGDLDPEVEESVIHDLTAISNGDKDHRKKSDLPSTENQYYLLHMTQNFQEITNPRNPINRFNNGNVKHVAGIKYEAESHEVQSTSDQQAEKSWKRLERLGGDYSRAGDPLSLLPASEKVSANGKAVLENVSQLLSQNKSIGLQDKKKMLRAVEKGLGGY
ncbi:hypothetical protein BGX34_006072 [Mortierella sp. NVP85]|nr:hypothetical protein BGX34_006072 [Mortierella sp. NVP85]